MIINRKLIKLITEYLITFEKLIKLNRYLYKNTELFEQREEKDFLTELFYYIAGKSSVFTKQYNQLRSTIPDELLKEIVEQRFYSER